MSDFDSHFQLQMSYLYDIKRVFHLTLKYDQSLIIGNVVYFFGSDVHVNHKLDIFLPSPNVNLATTSNEQQEIAEK